MFTKQIGTLPRMTAGTPTLQSCSTHEPHQAQRAALKDLLKGRWLVRIRWASLGAYSIVAAIAVALLGIRSDLPVLCGILLVGAASNVALSLVLPRRQQRAALLCGLALSLDVALLASLLFLYGGYTNPFSMVFLVYVTLAAFFLNARWTWWIFGLSSAAFISLFFFHIPLEQLSMGSGHGGMDHAAMMMDHDGGAGGFSLHLHGMLVAFLVIGLITSVFLGRLSRELEEQSSRLESMAERERDARQLMSLASLTAGAAHELATPLGTISLIAEELKRELGESAAWREDMQVLGSELARCEQVLARMRAQSSELAGEAPAWVTVDAVLSAVGEELRPGEKLKVESVGAGQSSLYTLKSSLVSSLSALVRNGAQASAEGEAVTLKAQPQADGIEFVVSDRGGGMSTEVLARVGDPFFTTKGSGQGLGLGVFLVKLFASQVGGAFSMSSEVGKGSEARLLVPREAAL